MKTPRYADMVSLTEALYRAESAKMQALLAEERRLRAELEQLEARRRATIVVTDECLLGYREIGADLMWQSWIGRSKAHLHADLARILGRKGQVIIRLRRTYGKYLAATQLFKDETESYARQREARRLSLLEDLGQLQQSHAK